MYFREIGKYAVSLLPFMLIYEPLISSFGQRFFYNITIYMNRPELCVTVDQSVSPPHFPVAPV